MIHNSDKVEAKQNASKLLEMCKKRDSKKVPFLVCKTPITYVMIPKNMKKKDRELVRERVVKRMKSK